MRVVVFFPLLAGGVLLPRLLPAQGQPGPAAPGFTLQQCVAFALAHTPALQQARLDEEIADRDVKANLSGWYPQVTARANLQRNLKLPVSFVPDFTDLSSGRRVPVAFGVANNANALFQADQTLYSSELLLASRGVRLRSRQQVQAARITTVVNVSKAYYDILLTQEQVRVFGEAGRSAQAAGDFGGFFVFYGQNPGLPPGGGPEKSQEAGRVAGRRVCHDVYLHGQPVRQRLYPLRPQLPGGGPGRYGLPRWCCRPATATSFRASAGKNAPRATAQ